MDLENKEILSDKERTLYILKEQHGDFDETTRDALREEICTLIRQILKQEQWKPPNLRSEFRWKIVYDLYETVLFFGLTKRMKKPLKYDIAPRHPKYLLYNLNRKISKFLLDKKNKTKNIKDHVLHLYGPGCDPRFCAGCLVCKDVGCWCAVEFAKWCVEQLNLEIQEISGSEEFTIYDVVNYSFSQQQTEAIERCLGQESKSSDYNVLSNIHPAFPTKLLAIRAYELQQVIGKHHQNRLFQLFVNGDVSKQFSTKKYLHSN